MSNRTDFYNVSEEVLRMFGCEGVPGYAMLRDRITTELHDAFVAGQDARVQEHQTFKDEVKTAVEDFVVREVTLVVKLDRMVKEVREVARDCAPTCNGDGLAKRLREIADRGEAKPS